MNNKTVWSKESEKYFDGNPIAQEIYRRVIQVERVEDLSPEERYRYEYDLKFVRDYINTIQYAAMKAYESGKQKAIKQRKEKLVLDMFAYGIDLDTIAEIANTTVAEVKDIINSRE